MSLRTRRYRTLISLLALLILTPISSLPIQAQIGGVIERGPNYIIKDLGGNKRSWESAPQWVYDTSQTNWAPYIYSRDDAKKCYQVQVGLIGAKIYDTGIIEIYDPDLTEVRVKGESWEIWSSGKKATLNSPITWSVVTNSSGVFITRRQTTSKPDGVLVINYIFLVGSGLKHTVEWISSEKVTVTVQVKQIHLMNFDKVSTDAGTVTASKSEKSVAYLFGYGLKDFWLFENQYAMVYGSTGALLTEKCLQNGEVDFAGKKVTYTFGDWTLASGESLEIDPDTVTLNNPTEDGKIAYASTYTRDKTGSYLVMGYYHNFPQTSYTHRAYVEWDVSSIPDAATITNTVFYYDGYVNNRDCHIHAIASKPSTSSDSGLYADIGDGTVYVDPVGFPVVTEYYYSEVDLGTSADTDLKNQLTSDWFAIGIQSDDETGTTNYLAYIYSEEGGGGFGVAPALYVVYTTNTAPVNGAASITDMDDTNNVYAQRKLYTGSSVATDADGYGNIHYMEFRIKQGAATRATFQYHEDDNTFNTQSGSTEWTLDASSSASRAGNTITVTWKFAAQWDATEEAALEIELYVIDAVSASDTDVVQTNYFDVVKTLTISVFASNPVTYVNPSTSVTFSGTVYYVNNPASSTPTTFYPPDAEFTSVAVHDAAHSTKGTDTTIVNGAFSLSFNSDAAVGADTYHPFIAMADADYTDADASGISDSVTVEQVKVISYTVADTRLDISTNVNVDFSLQYASDSANVVDGTVTLNTGAATYQSGSTWRRTVTSAVVAGTTYNTVAASGNTRAITSVDQNSQSVLVVWDRIRILTLSLTDNRINADGSSTSTLYATADLEYDAHTLGSGDSLTISGVALSWSAGNSRFEGTTASSSSVTSTTYNAFTSGNEASYGITAGNINGKTATLVFDKLQVQSYTVADARVNINDNVNIDFLLYYDYDDSAVTDGTVTLNGLSASHQGSGNWRITQTSVSVTSVTYDTAASTGNTHGITTMDQNGKSTSVVWDRLQVQSYAVSDSRVNINDNMNIDALVWFDYDDTVCTTGTITINGYSAAHQGSGVYRITRTSATVTSVTYNTVACSAESTYGITTVDQNGKSTTVIWDRLDFISVAVDDSRINVGGTFELRYVIQYDYDNVVFDNAKGSITGFIYDAVNLWWNKTVTGSSSVASTNYDETYISISDTTYDLTAKEDDTGVNIITDRIRIDTLSATDGRIDVSTSGEWYGTASLEYDGHVLGAGDSLSLGGYTFTWDAGQSRWEATNTKSTVQAVSVNIFASGNEATYGITVGNINAQTATIIWDRLEIVSVAFDDSRINVSGSAEVRYVLRYDYDDIQFDDTKGSVTGFAWDSGNSWWDKAITGSATVGSENYDETDFSYTDTTYGLTVKQDVAGANIITDRIRVLTLGLTDNRINADGFSTSTLYATADLEYDAHTLGSGDSLTISGVALSWSAGNSRFEGATASSVAVTSTTYNAFTSGSEATYSITAGDINSKTTTLIFDKVQVQSYTVADARVNINDNVNIDVLVWFDYDDTVYTTGTIMINGFSATHQGAGVYRITRTSATVVGVTYNTVAVSAESTYGITTADQNSKSQLVVWDRIKLLTLTANATALNLGSPVEVLATAELEYDNHALGSGDALTISTYVFTWDVPKSKWRWDHTEASTATITLNNFTSGNEATYGITIGTMNSLSKTIIWEISKSGGGGLIIEHNYDLKIVKVMADSVFWSWLPFYSPKVKADLSLINMGVSAETDIKYWIEDKDGLLLVDDSQRFLASFMDEKNITVTLPAPEEGEKNYVFCFQVKAPITSNIIRQSFKLSSLALVDLNGDGIIDAWGTKGDKVIDAWDINGNGVEDTWDTNHDGIPDSFDINGDTIIDVFDTDGDGVVDTINTPRFISRNPSGVTAIQNPFGDPILIYPINRWTIAQKGIAILLGLLFVIIIVTIFNEKS